MIYSMTGYGSSEQRVDGVTYIVEVKTVNNRYFKSKIQLPGSISYLEETVEALLRSRIGRGMVNCVVYMKDAPASLLFDIDEGILEELLKKVERIAKKAKAKYTIDVASLLNLPDVISPAKPDTESMEKLKAIILELAEKAIIQVKQMRANEGASLREDLERHCKEIRDKMALIKERSDTVLKGYAERLKKRAEELLDKSDLKIDEQSVAKEVAFFAERSDISEEIDRLESHIDQFIVTCKGSNEGEQAGRRLDFICQEMLREANTIASKAADSQIIHTVVDIKCIIDRIKEQVQNVE
jgi:uncharacterized protein (TIGR00255 family)